MSFELFRRGLRDLDVVTYDDLFARVRPYARYLRQARHQRTRRAPQMGSRDECAVSDSK
jgi:hypothetical protein